VDRLECRLGLLDGREVDVANLDEPRTFQTSLPVYIFAAGVLGDIVARWRRPPDSRRLRPSVAWVAMPNLRRSSGCSNAS